MRRVWVDPRAGFGVCELSRQPQSAGGIAAKCQVVRWTSRERGAENWRGRMPTDAQDAHKTARVLVVVDQPVLAGVIQLALTNGP